MPPGAAAPSLNSALPIIFHNIPYANLGCGAGSEPFGYPLVGVKEMRRTGRGFAGASPAPLHG
jgi:hypothetical protein